MVNQAFWRELQWRKVRRAAALYAGRAWALSQEWRRAAASRAAARGCALWRNPGDMFRWLDPAGTHRDGGVQFLLLDSFIPHYKADPRFEAFARKVVLPVATGGRALP